MKTRFQRSSKEIENRLLFFEIITSLVTPGAFAKRLQNEKWPKGSKVSKSPYRTLTGNDIRGHYFCHYYYYPPPFFILFFQLRCKLFSERLLVILGLFGCHLDFAGSEQVPLVLLGWYCLRLIIQYQPSNTWGTPSPPATLTPGSTSQIQKPKSLPFGSMVTKITFC